MFLLDTHVWLWALDEDTTRLGRRTLRAIDRWSEADALRVSPLSAFEVAWLHTAGRITLSRSLDDWIEAALDSSRIRLAPLTTEVAMAAGSMGSSVVPDPIDRMLIATARGLDATLVTRDRRILDYASTSAAVRVHDATA